MREWGVTPLLSIARSHGPQPTESGRRALVWFVVWLKKTAGDAGCLGRGRSHEYSVSILVQILVDCGSATQLKIVHPMTLF